MSYKHILIFFKTQKSGSNYYPHFTDEGPRSTWLKVTWLVSGSNMGSLVPFIDAANISLSTYYGPGRILSTGNTGVNTKDEVPGVTKH